MSYDVIVAGAGSVGVPTAMSLAELGIKALVIDMHPSPGQGENKHAIGGIRATHSTPGKIRICRRSIELFSTWQQQHGDNIEWLQGGYVYPVYRPEDEKLLKGLLPAQKKHGLNIKWVGRKKIIALIPGISAAAKSRATDWFIKAPNMIRITLGGIRTLRPRTAAIAPMESLRS